jgi:hypothetical protein
MKAIEVYKGSDGDQTRAFYAMLEQRGPIGKIAVNLFRAVKCSSRANVYRGGIRGQGSYRSMAYDRKNWAIANLCTILQDHAADWGIGWGWKQDPVQEYHDWVLYVDLPDGLGQVSFHAATRGVGPDYPFEWDNSHKSPERICTLCDRVAMIVVAAAAEGQ